MHSISMCLIVSWQLHPMQNGGSSPRVRCWWVSFECPISNRVIMTFSLLDRWEEVLCFKFGLILNSLFSVSDFHSSFQRDLIYSFIFGRKSEYGSLGVLLSSNCTFEASFASVSACSLPSIPMWLGIQQKVRFFPICVVCWIFSFKHIILVSKGFICSRAWRLERESVRIRKFVFGECFISLRASSSAPISAEKMDASGGESLDDLSGIFLCMMDGG